MGAPNPAFFIPHSSLCIAVSWLPCSHQVYVERTPAGWSDRFIDYCCLHKTCQNTNKHKIGACLRAKIVRAISREPIAQSSRSLLQSTRLYFPQGLVPSVSLILHISPFYKLGIKIHLFTTVQSISQEPIA